MTDLAKVHLLEVADSPEVVDDLYLSFLRSQEKEKQTTSFNPIKPQDSARAAVSCRDRLIAAGKSKAKANEIVKNVIDEIKKDFSDLVVTSDNQFCPSPWLIETIVENKLSKIKGKKMR